MKGWFWLRSEAVIEARYEIVRVGARYVVNGDMEVIEVLEPSIRYLLRLKEEKLLHACMVKNA